MIILRIGELEDILENHKLWIVNNNNGKCADLSNASLSGANLKFANLSGANLSIADLSSADLSNADLSGANLSSANLSGANLSSANLSGADLKFADLSGANLKFADLSGADLSGANLKFANLSGADLSGCKGLLDPIEWLSQLERNENGIIAYKIFDRHYLSPDYWKIEKGQILTEVVNPNRTNDCGCGINVATFDWIRTEYPRCSDSKVWKVLIKWEWLSGVVVPFHTNGKFRCSRVQLIDTIQNLEKEV